MDPSSAPRRRRAATTDAAPWATHPARRTDSSGEPFDLRQTGRHHRAHEHRVSARRIAVILTVLALLAGIGIGGIAALRLAGNLTSSPLNLSDGADSTDEGPLDILVMGSDTRSGRGNSAYGSKDDAEGRTDVMMLVHVTERRDAVTVVSFPRDLIVDIPQCTDPETHKVYPAEKDMLNSAVERGGPGCTVAAIDELTGVSIDHFMLADFNAVKELSSAVGGVQVCVNEAVDDPKSGLKLPAGISSVEGEQALAFLRSRAAFGNGGDESRIRSQQSLLASLTRKIQADGTLADLPQLYRIAEVMTQNLHVDQGLTSIPTLVDTARTFNGIDPGRIAFVTAPTRPHPQDPNRLQLNEKPADDLFATLRRDVAVTGAKTSGSPAPSGKASGGDAARGPGAATSSSPATTPEETGPAVDPAIVPVSVSNRSEAGGRDAQVVRTLAKAGYRQARSESSGPQLAATQIFYAPDWAPAAEDVARTLNVSRDQLVASYDVAGIEVAVGQDFTSGDRMTGDRALPEDLQGQTAEQFTCQATAEQ
ncbi:LCP family protein [Kocuria tytonis]|uniref:LytR family transcriptional regulator n=1 Tax=Kocuria tytonis TaxID=2054280 RepID=A0A495A8V7_9MICC|nr:LCP family protein [Kocuria tytonis]RKQ36388.1 LytR family transcriptional regulator [Kocuria tytonis]